MKRLMMVLACLAAFAASAAQCEGKTLQGERCKREAAEGSKFCIGHADQAKAAADKKAEADKKAAAPAKKAEAKKAEAEALAKYLGDDFQAVLNDGSFYLMSDIVVRLAM